MEYLLPFLYFLQPGILWPELAEYRPVIVLLAIGFLFSLGRVLPGEGGAILRHPVTRWLGLFVAVQVVSVFRAGLEYLVSEAMFLGLLFAFMLVSARLVDNEERLWRFVLGTIAGGMCVVLFGLRAVQVGLETAVGGRAGAYGMYENHNDYTFIIIMILPFIAACFRLSRGVLIRGVLALCALACVAGVFLSLSRGGMLALVLEVGLLMWVMMRRRVVYWLLPIFLAVAVLAIQYQYSARAENQGDVYTAEDAESSRFELWRAGWAMFKARPLTGVGSRLFSDYSSDYGEISHDNRGKNSHNTYIEIAAGTGIPGLVCFGMLIWTMFRRLRRAPGQADSELIGMMRTATWVALISILFRSFFNAKQFDNSFYFLAAMTVIVGVLAESASRASPSAAAGVHPPRGRSGAGAARRLPTEPIEPSPSSHPTRQTHG